MSPVRDVSIPTLIKLLVILKVFPLRYTLIPTSGSRAWFTVVRCNRRKRELENEIEEKVERRRDRKVRE